MFITSSYINVKCSKLHGMMPEVQHGVLKCSRTRVHVKLWKVVDFFALKQLPPCMTL